MTQEDILRDVLRLLDKLGVEYMLTGFFASNVQPFPEYGSWWYDNVAGSANLGTVRVNCTHTDTKGSVWTSY